MPDQRDLIDVGPRRKPTRPTFRQTRPIWTENKAKLIERYLYYFLMVTKHGTYIDAFAGPQEETGETVNWSAKLVLELRPPWIKHLYLFEQNPEQVDRLKALVRKNRTPLGKRQRDVHIIGGDMNVELPAFLTKRPVRSTEATFCLLDQRTFECQWATVATVARHKKKGNKIELFYFFANSWLARALAATTTHPDKVDAWWGGNDWKHLRELDAWARGRLVAERFCNEFGYAYAAPWPIYDKSGGKRIMYFMIHASDHPEAPGLMQRAYEKAVEPLETQHELQLMFRVPPAQLR